MSAAGLPFPLKLIAFLRLNAPGRAPLLRVLLLVVYGATLLVTVAGFLIAAALPLHGNIHDIFIWVNAGQFIEMGLRPHVDFSSPLGPLYLYANYAAWRLTDNVADMPLLVGFGFAAGFGALLLAYRSFLQRWLLPEALVLIAILALSGRQMGALDVNLTWYGGYNRLCWIALFILALVVLGRNAAALDPSRSERLRIALLAGGLLGLTFFIKINFFVAVAAIYGGWLVGSGAFRDWRAWAVPALVFALSVAGAVLLGLDVAGYLGDIVRAGAARESAAASGFFHPVAFVLAIVLVAANVIADFLIGNWEGLRARLVLYAGLSAGLFLGIAGDFAKPLEVFLIVLAYRLVDAFPRLVARPDRELLAVLPLTAIIVTVSLVFLVIEFYSVVLTSIYRLGGYSDARSQPVVWSAAAPSNKVIRLRIAREAERNDYSQLAKIIANLPERETLLKTVGGLRVPLFDLSNKTYAAQVEEGRAVMQRLGRPSDRVLFPLEFSNPYPFLLGTRPPSAALLWYHDGTTFNGSAPADQDEAFEHSDVVLVPHVSVDSFMRPVLNAMFERYNARTSRFCEFHTGLYWSFYRRCSPQD